MRSASIMSAPCSASMADTVDFPAPMPPVRPTTSMRRDRSAGSGAPREVLGTVRDLLERFPQVGRSTYRSGWDMADADTTTPEEAALRGVAERVDPPPWRALPPWNAASRLSATLRERPVGRAP